MKHFNFTFPLYAKLTLTLLSLTLITIALYIGQNILIPLLLSLLFAILLRPMVIFFNKKLRLPHVISVLVSVVLFVILIGTIILFISWQVSEITDDWKKIKYNISIHSDHIQHWIKQRYNVSYNKQQNFVHRIADDTLNGDTELMGNTLSSFTDTLLKVVLIPIYTFLILLYRNLFIKFLVKIVSQKNEQILLDILTHVKTVVQSYIIGLLIETGVVAVLTTGGLILLGVQYAVLLGVITAILNLIPYIGILVACVITLLATLVNSTDVSVMLGVIALSVLVQFIDNNILVPKIVGNKVRINALVSMVGVIIGGAIAGIAGMFLAIPLIAILKVIFDRIESLSPLGFLMGDDLPKTYDWYKLKLPDFSQGNSEDTWPEQIRNDLKDKTQ
jgi:predicted PurR-regulated permease PerM